MFVIALVVYAAILYLTDIKSYLDVLSWNNRLPVLTNLSGLALFILLLSLMWVTARRSYATVFGRHYQIPEFLVLNIRAILPVVLPWIVLSLFYDLLALTPSENLQLFIDSAWGDALFFGLFLAFIVIFFPPLVRRLWGCMKIPEGVLNDHLRSFCNRQNFSVSLYIWPLYEGRVLTAGVMGLVPRLRYILLTPAIIETMSIQELEAVLAHEIAHVKKKHLLQYVLLIGGFSLMAGILAEPFFYYAFSFEWVFNLLTSERLNPDTVVGLVIGLPFLVLLLLYFRFVFGFFSRNFERQADLYVIKMLGSGSALISAFDKIADTSGQNRNKPNWHHFSIAERIDALERSERNPALIERQDRKVRRNLMAFVFIIVSVIALARQVPIDQLARDYEAKYIEFDFISRVKDIEDKALWYQLVGDLMIQRQLENRAMVAYNKALELDPDNPVALNNLAWLLLTSEDQSLRDPLRALTLAQRAVLRSSESHVLDTLATAYWANGFIDEAISTEQEALSGATTQREFYQDQIERFKTESYDSDRPI